MRHLISIAIDDGFHCASHLDNSNSWAPDPPVPMGGRHHALLVLINVVMIARLRQSVYNIPRCATNLNTFESNVLPLLISINSTQLTFHSNLVFLAFFECFHPKFTSDNQCTVTRKELIASTTAAPLSTNFLNFFVSCFANVV